MRNGAKSAWMSTAPSMKSRPSPTASPIASPSSAGPGRSSFYFSATLVAWTILNSVVLAWYSAAFDPYPYIFLNLMLSMLAALQAPVILMSQNRQAARDRLAAGHDYEVNLKAELEIMGLHEKLDRIRSEHLEELLRAQQEQLGLLTQLIGLNGKAGSGSGV